MATKTAQQLAAEAEAERTRSGNAQSSADTAQNRYVTHLAGGQDALNTYTQGAMSSAMPQLQGTLQSVRENAIRRGITTGDLGTSYEGDVLSAFQRNISNAAAGQAMNLYNTQAGGYGRMYEGETAVAEGSRNRYLDLLAGNRDYEIMVENMKRERRGGLFGGLGAVAGGVGGFLVGGPAGAYAGAKIGGSAGKAVGG